MARPMPPALDPPDPPDSVGPQVAGTAAFSKFMPVLQIVADWPEGGEAPRVTALVRASGSPRPTVHRIALPRYTHHPLTDRATLRPEVEASRARGTCRRTNASAGFHCGPCEDPPVTAPPDPDRPPLT